MAVGGMMKVRGKVDGADSGDSATIRVTKRTWPRLTLNVRELGHGELPAATEIRSDGDLAHAHVDTLSFSLAAAIADGPNAGWVFLDSMAAVPVTIHVSAHWGPGNVWYQLQHVGPWTDPLTGLVHPHCAQHQLPLLRTEARRHEGSLSWSQTSHVDVFHRWKNTNTPQDSLEAAVAYRPVGGSAIWSGGVYSQFVRGPMMTDANQRHVNAVPPGMVNLAVFPCKLRFFP
jgi:hypothetical protein